MDAAMTLTLTVAALLVSGAGAWWTRRASTRQYRVKALTGFATPGGMIECSSDNAVRWANAQGFREPVIGVRVYNIGSVAATVQAWRVSGSTFSYHPVTDMAGPPLPYRIDAGATGVWYTSSAGMHLLGGDRLRVSVTFGDGTTVTSRPLALPKS